MDDGAFANLADLVHRRAGIVLTADKAPSIARRLASVAHVFGFRDSKTLLAELAYPHEELARAVTEAVTTQDTAFFRDPGMFAYFKDDVLPAMIVARAARKRLRIWSAGCATGQEAYSIAMMLDESNLVAEGWNFDLIATDFSSDAIARAKSGVYSQYEIQRGLPVPARSRHFIHGADGWRANERLRRAVMFRTFNLLDHFGWLGSIDIIFCRNVLIYLAPEEKAAVAEKFARTLAQDGRLVLGAAEGSADMPAPFKTAPGPRGIFLKQA
jgi:chemotaxis protein methyltransferase CheR